MRAASFDDLVGESEHLWWNLDSERLRGFEIDNEFESRGRLYRKIGGFGPKQNAVDILRCWAEVINDSNSIGGKRPLLRMGTKGMY